MKIIVNKVTNFDPEKVVLHFVQNGKKSTRPRLTVTTKRNENEMICLLVGPAIELIMAMLE